MKLFLANISGNLATLGCVVVAGLLAMKGKDGWGWFLVVAVVCQVSYKSTGKKDV
jgi:type IV secretory pathway VirB2 component (pilin)